MIYEFPFSSKVSLISPGTLAEIKWLSPLGPLMQRKTVEESFLCARAHPFSLSPGCPFE